MLKSKNRRLQKFTLFEAQKVFGAWAVLSSLVVLQLGCIARPFSRI